MSFTTKLAQRLRKPGFRNVSEPRNQCPLFHSTALHSTLLHSATLNNETLQNNVKISLWVETSLYLWCVCDDVRRHYQQTSCQVTFLTPLLKGAAEKLLNFPCLPSHQNVTKQNMFSYFRSKQFIFVTLQSFEERACARNAEPANVSELLWSYIVLFVLLCLYGKIKKRLAC